MYTIIIAYQIVVDLIHKLFIMTILHVLYGLNSTLLINIKMHLSFNYGFDLP